MRQKNLEFGVLEATEGSISKGRNDPSGQLADRSSERGTENWPSDLATRKLLVTFDESSFRQVCSGFRARVPAVPAPCLASAFSSWPHSQLLHETNVHEILCPCPGFLSPDVAEILNLLGSGTLWGTYINTRSSSTYMCNYVLSFQGFTDSLIPDPRVRRPYCRLP